MTKLKIEEALRHVDFWRPGILDTDIKTAGDNLSVGQKQLICLARALIRKSKIMVLDEATASIDYKSDETIQKALRAEFTEFTVLTIARTINTIMNYDKVVVMNSGLVQEYGSPTDLMSQKGAFYNLAMKH